MAQKEMLRTYLSIANKDLPLQYVAIMPSIFADTRHHVLLQDMEMNTIGNIVHNCISIKELVKNKCFNKISARYNRVFKACIYGNPITIKKYYYPFKLKLMARLGSFSDPYDYSTYQRAFATGAWLGDWVLVDGVKVYINRENERYSGKGEYTNPFPLDIYDEIYNHEEWIGGWVVFSGTVRYYYDSSSTSYDNNYGSSIRPWPMSIYNEMCNNGIWIGGWVMYDDGFARLIQNFVVSEGSDCGFGSGDEYGCGCGFGCEEGGSNGCGCGSTTIGSGCIRDNNPIDGRILSGSGVIGTLFNKKCIVSVSWTSGNTIIENNRSVINITLSFEDSDYSLVSYDLCGEWIARYEAKITGSVSYIKEGTQQVAYLINAGFSVPESYRVDRYDEEHGI